MMAKNIAGSWWHRRWVIARYSPRDGPEAPVDAADGMGDTSSILVRL
jgi:hypothetical protein